MTAKVKTKAVNRATYSNFLKKAEELHESMISAYGERHWNSCVITAIHCSISAIDALTVNMIGVKSAGDRHGDVVMLLPELGLDPSEMNAKRSQILGLLDVKNIAEYNDQLMSEADADKAMKYCDRIFAWVKEKLDTSNSK
jgi:hypothetical protein